MKETRRKADQRPPFTLMTKFNVISLVILIVGCIVVSGWVSRQIELRVLARVGHTTSLFAGSVISPAVERLVSENGSATPGSFTSSLDINQLGPDIVAFKIWNRDGVVLLSSNPSEVGGSFEVEEGLAQAWSGIVSTEISQLDRAEHEIQRQSASRLIETYAPIRRSGTGEIVAVIEFYQDVQEFEREIASARWQTWGIVTLLVVAIYLALVILVRSGSRTIGSQRHELEQRVQESERLLEQNRELNTRLRAAAVRTTTLNEEYLRRIAAELHDGPAQDIGYALLNVGGQANGTVGEKRSTQPDTILRRALDEIRGISAGLRSPELEKLNLGEVITRAIAVHKSRTGCTVQCEVEDLPESTHLAAKITIYRVLQEALSNAHLHAGEKSPSVRVCGDGDYVHLRVSDNGPGIESGNGGAGSRSDRAHLGMAVMTERVELLGGQLRVVPNQPSGTVVEARVPCVGATIDGLET